MTSRLDIFTVVLSSVLDKNRRFEIEVGGKNKRKKQINDLDNAFIFKDGIDIGYAESVYGLKKLVSRW